MTEKYAVGGAEVLGTPSPATAAGVDISDDDAAHRATAVYENVAEEWYGRGQPYLVSESQAKEAWLEAIDVLRKDYVKGRGDADANLEAEERAKEIAEELGWSL